MHLEVIFDSLEFGLIPSAIAYDLLLFLYFVQYHSSFELDHVCFTRECCDAPRWGSIETLSIPQLEV